MMVGDASNKSILDICLYSSSHPRPPLLPLSIILEKEKKISPNSVYRKDSGGNAKNRVNPSLDYAPTST